MNEGRQITVLEPGQPHGELDNLKVAHEMLQLAGSPKELRRVADYAEAMRYAALKAGMGVEAQNEAAELTIRAMREIGTMLIEALCAPPPCDSYTSYQRLSTASYDASPRRGRGEGPTLVRAERVAVDVFDPRGASYDHHLVGRVGGEVCAGVERGHALA